MIANFTPVVRYGYRIGLPHAGRWREALNTDAQLYGGSNVGNWAPSTPRPSPRTEFAASAPLTLPPLATVFLRYEGS